MTSAAKNAARESDNSGQHLQWPQNLPHDPQLKIGEVRRILNAEFPMLSVSKIRHYESVGLISPHRTATNQRLFSQADVERLRFVLREQRDSYLPLDQIREELHQLDSGVSTEHPRTMRLVNGREVRRPQPGERLRVGEVADITGIEVATIQAVIDAGILQTDARGRLSAQAPDVMRYTVMLLEAGFDLHQVRAVRTSAHSHAHAILASLAPQLAKKSAVERERALARADENLEKFARLYRALLAEDIEVSVR